MMAPNPISLFNTPNQNERNQHAAISAYGPLRGIHHADEAAFNGDHESEV